MFLLVEVRSPSVANRTHGAAPPMVRTRSPVIRTKTFAVGDTDIERGAEGIQMRSTVSSQFAYAWASDAITSSRVYRIGLPSSSCGSTPSW